MKKLKAVYKDDAVRCEKCGVEIWDGVDCGCGLDGALHEGIEEAYREKAKKHWEDYDEEEEKQHRKELKEHEKYMRNYERLMRILKEDKYTTEYSERINEKIENLEEIEETDEAMRAAIKYVIEEIEMEDKNKK